MSRLTDLLAQAKAKDPQLGSALESEFKELTSRRSFGLNFEKHTPEAVEVPGRPARVGDTVRLLPPRGEVKRTDMGLYRVLSIEAETAQVVSAATESPEPIAWPIHDLIVVLPFSQPIYPGLKFDGEVINGEPTDPAHIVINSENYHALKALTFTHRNTVDVIYIDPPYNSRAKDWKYNNDYVDPGDTYQHSKWLAMMERRLSIAKSLLRPENSALIVTIDEKEVNRLGLLLEQVFPEARIQMVSATINPKGTSRPDMFSRVDEFIFFVLLGSARVPDILDETASGKPVRWRYLRREDDESVRGSRPAQFYPVFVDPTVPKIVGVGEPLAPDVDRNSIEAPEGQIAVFGISPDGREMEWGLTGPSLMKAVEEGFVRVTKGKGTQPFTISYLTRPNIEKIKTGELVVEGTKPDGSKIVVSPEGKWSRPKTVWRESRHSAGDYGTQIISSLLPRRRFSFPKSLYAVEDTLRFFVADKPDAVVLDFFAGSGTTAHAVMRLNTELGGRRQSICVTNNEVSEAESTSMMKQGLRPGDPKFEERGICEYLTKPRIEAAITGRTPAGDPINDDYKFINPGPMSEGFAANAAFYTLTYESEELVSHNLAFSRIAPLLWLRAGGAGRVIETINDQAGYEIADTYGVLFKRSKSRAFAQEIAQSDGIRVAYIVTDSPAGFQSAAQALPAGVEAVRLYENYLVNFKFMQE